MSPITGPTTDLDPKLLARVRALLAKAESTTFPEEADALTAKAQELMSRHAIDAAMVDDPDVGGSAPDHRILVVDPPYASAKLSVLGGVAAANRCQVVFTQPDERAHLFGFSVDLDVVEVLYTSLLLQATAAMTAAGSKTDRTGRSRTRSFRHGFLLAFAARISERLAEATRATITEVDEARRGALVPVLAHRDDAVDRALRKAFPQVKARRLSASSPEGLNAGRTAADRADLGTTRLRRSSRGQARLGT
jgi:hypothetical protein